MNTRHTIPAEDASHLSLSIPKAWVGRAMDSTNAKTKSIAFRSVILAGLVYLETIKRNKEK